MSSDASDGRLRVWRHPRPEGATGLCVGAGTDLPVHWRRAKRLARRIQAVARRERLPHLVYSSPLRRCADVGRWLQRWGWRLTLDPALLELDFGRWDGRPWAQIEQAEVDAWVADFVEHAPGGGEPLAALLERVKRGPVSGIAISHGGWMLARRWLAEHGQGQGQGQVVPTAETWPRPPRYGEGWTF